MNSIAMHKKARASADANRLSRGAGFFSVALGVTELALPRLLGRAIGVAPSSTSTAVMRVLGARELASGTSLLLRPRHPLPMWSRVGGDLIDLGLLGLALRSRKASPGRIAGAIAAVAGVMVIDAIAARRLQRAYEAANRPVLASVTINKTPTEVYEFFRRFEQLPSFMDYLASVERIGPTRTRWTAKLPVGEVSWTAEITEDVPGEVIAWRSVEDSPVQTRGRVTFTRTPGRDMTEVRVELQLSFTGGAPSTTLAKWFAQPQLRGDLRRLKQVLETGEVLVSDASAHREPHPAQPSSEIDHRPVLFIENPPTAAKGVAP